MVVRRRIEREHATRDMGRSGPREANSRTEKSLELASIASSTTSATKIGETSQPWTANTTQRGRSWATIDATDSWVDPKPAVYFNMDIIAFAKSIPSILKQNIEETSTCFFFRYYGGTAIDPEVRSGFNQIWQPMYLDTSIQSPLRLATTAVTVNITMMLCFRGCDSRPARKFFTKAVAAAREALHDPCQSSTDEMLMAILIFDLYDALVLHYSPSPLDYGKHKHGALAIIEHRGLANFATPRARALIAAVRHSLLPYMLSSRKPFPKRLDYLFDHPSINDTKAAKLDLISAQLSRVQSRLWTLRLDTPLERGLEERHTCYDRIIAEALQVEECFVDWKTSIVNPNWLPESVPHDAVVKSIQDAGFYGTHCNVWVDLAFAGIAILYWLRCIYTLQIVRQSFADEKGLFDTVEKQSLLSRVNDSVQELVDSICDSIPFFLGDTVSFKNPMYSTTINFPYVFRTDRRTGMHTRVPSLRSNHHHRAAASGGWVLFPQRVNLWRLAEPEDGAVPIILRHGQLDWIQSQVGRLQKVFLFSDPVWFKRMTPYPAESTMK